MLIHKLLGRAYLEGATDDGGAGGGGSNQPAARPDYVPEQFWDAKTGAANVQALATEYTKTNTELTKLRESAPKVPDKYELTLGDGALLKPDAIERTAAAAKALGLSQESAQKALDFAHGEVKTYHESLMGDHQARTQQWLTDAKADKAIAGEKGDQFDANVRLAMNAFSHWFGEDIKKELEVTGFGNHPGVLRGFLKIAQAMADDKFVSGGQGGGNSGARPDIATRLYGKVDGAPSSNT